MSDNRTTELTAAQVRECVEHLYWDGYNDGYIHRGHGIEEIDWQAITDELNAVLGDLGVLYMRGQPGTDHAAEQTITATLGSDASAVRLAERLRSIAYEMRSVGASSMTPHELLACYANDVEKVADSLMFAATRRSRQSRQSWELR